MADGTLGTLVSKLSGDTTIKAVMYGDTVLKAKLTGGLTVNQIVDGGEYIHFDVITSANNQTFTSNLLAQYSGTTSINLMKNGVFLEPTTFTKPSANSIQVNVLLEVGDVLDVLATGSATIVVPSGGSNTQIQYNNDGIFAGSNSFTFNNTTNTVNATTLIGNTITSNHIISNITANVSNLNASGTVNLGNVGNVKITGGINGYFLQTDGFGNLNWGAGGGGGGNGTPGGANTQIQFNDNGAFGASPNLTFNTANATLSATRIAGSLITNAQPNITSVGVLSSLTVNGTLAATLFQGNGAFLNNINGSNVSIVPNATQANNATTANTAATVTTNAQPNITSVGTLTSLTVSGNMTGNGSHLTAINGSNVSGTVNSANTAVFAGTVTTNAQPNITSVGTLGNVTVSGIATANIFLGTLYGAANTAATVTTAAQPNITTVGTLLNLTVAGNAVAGAVRTDTLTYANGTAWTFPGTYSNSNVQSFLPTYTGTLSPSSITIVAGSAKTLSEPVSVVAASPSATQNIDVIDNTFYFYTVSIAQNSTVNFRGNSSITLNATLSTGQSMTIGMLVTNALSVGYTLNNVQIDGSAQTIRWLNGTPSPVTTGIDAYVFTIIKTASNTYTVIGNRGTTT
jgi:hypothetical protein